MTDGLNILKSALPAKSWTDDPDTIAPWLTEWRDKYQGHTPLMLMPGSTEEVATVVKICAEHNIKIVPQGGNTGLVGGQTPQGEVLLSTRRLNKVRNVNPVTNAMVVEAGVNLQAVQDAADSQDRKFPLSLASQGSCTIGGNLSTNAGGVHVLKYGTTKELVFGVEAVLPNGEIYNGLTSLRKDNTGYDLSRLFLGAEGTLGIITAASLKLFPKPGYIQRALLGVNTAADAVTLLDLMRAGDSLAMFEVIPRIGIELVTTYIPNQRDPFEIPHNWYVVVDWETDTAEQGVNIAESKLTKALNSGLIQDAVIAQNETQAAELLALRENMSAAQKPYGGSVKLDITVPIDKIAEFLSRADAETQKIVPDCRPVSFGHFGDGNIHYNIAQPADMDRETYLSQYWNDLSNCVFDIVDQLGGSISAEHGIGIMKKDDLAARADPAKVAMLKSIKQTLDPQNIMNPRVLV